MDDSVTKSGQVRIGVLGGNPCFLSFTDIFHIHLGAYMSV